MEMKSPMSAVTVSSSRPKKRCVATVVRPYAERKMATPPVLHVPSAGAADGTGGGAHGGELRHALPRVHSTACRSLTIRERYSQVHVPREAPSTELLALDVEDKLSQLRLEWMLQHAAAHQGQEGTIVQVPAQLDAADDAAEPLDDADEPPPPATPSPEEVGLPILPRVVSARPSQPVGHLPDDHVVLCSCPCSGVAAASLERAARPRTRPPVNSYRPTPKLDMLVLPPNALPADLLERVKLEVKQLIKTPDDDIVPEHGCGPGEVRGRPPSSDASGGVGGRAGFTHGSTAPSSCAGPSQRHRLQVDAARAHGRVPQRPTTLLLRRGPAGDVDVPTRDAGRLRGRCRAMAPLVARPPRVRAGRAARHVRRPAL